MSRVVGQKLTNSLGGNYNKNVRLARDQVVLLKPRQVCVPAGVKPAISQLFLVLSWKVKQNT